MFIQYSTPISGWVQARKKSSLLLHKTVKRLQQRPVSGVIALQLGQRQRGRFQRRQLVRRVRLANPISRRRHVVQGDARQPLQPGIHVEHLAALAPGGVDDDEPQPAGLRRQARLEGGRRLARRLGIQQHRHAPVRMQQRVQAGIGERLPDFQPAAAQAQVQQARAVLGVAHFEWMLQDQQVDAAGQRPHPPADAGALRAQAGGAGGAPRR